MKFRNLTLAIAAAAAGSLLMASPAAACTIYSEYDDGSHNLTLDVDYSDDVAVKRLDGPSRVALLGSSARLDVLGLAYDCAVHNQTMVLTLNGTPIAQFDPCDVWPVQSYYWNSPGWTTFSFPADLVRTGSGTNTFSLSDVNSDWAHNNVYLGVDSNTSAGRSTMRANGTTVSGELMWRLTYSATICV